MCMDLFQNSPLENLFCMGCFRKFNGQNVLSIDRSKISAIPRASYRYVNSGRNSIDGVLFKLGEGQILWEYPNFLKTQSPINLIFFTYRDSISIDLRKQTMTSVCGDCDWWTMRNVSGKNIEYAA